MPQPVPAFAYLLAPLDLGWQLSFFMSLEIAMNHEHKTGRYGKRSGIEEERQGKPEPNEEAAKRWANKTVGNHLDAPHLGVGLLQTLGLDNGGQDRLRRVVSQHFGKPKQQRGNQQHRVHHRFGGNLEAGLDLGGSRQRPLLHQHKDRHQQCHHGPHCIHADHDLASIDPIGNHTCGQSKDEPRQTLRHRDQGYEHTIAGDRRGQPRIGDLGDTIAKVGYDAGRPQTPIPAPEMDLLVGLGHVTSSSSGRVGRRVG